MFNIQGSITDTWQNLLLVPKQKAIHSKTRTLDSGLRSQPHLQKSSTQNSVGICNFQKTFAPAALITEEFILSIQRLSRTEIAETTCDRAILLNIKTQVQERLISSSYSFTTQTPGFICQCSLHKRPYHIVDVKTQELQRCQSSSNSDSHSNEIESHPYFIYILYNEKLQFFFNLNQNLKKHTTGRPFIPGKSCAPK